MSSTEISNQTSPIITDPRVLNLSYSSLLTAHSCPRKFELDRKQSVRENNESPEESITFSYGQIVGLGIQLALERKPYEEIIWQMFLNWRPELFAENPKQNKSFAAAVFAIDKFLNLLSEGYLHGYSLVTYNGKPACELSFLITLPSGYKYRGFVDAVLQHDDTGEVVVLECKTSSATTLNPATYKNSAQAIGYSIVLDAIFPELSSYRVLYLVYSTKQLQYDQLEFSKSYVQRARWIRELVLDCDMLAMYEQNNLYPMRGESCFTYFRECQYMGLCQMDTDRLVSPISDEQISQIEKTNATYQIQITLDDLIQSQLSKVS
jgi:PD-(D/E)XK nuclease superfamily